MPKIKNASTIILIILVNLFFVHHLSASIKPTRNLITQEDRLVTSSAGTGLGTLRWALTNLQPNTRITFDPSIFPPANPTTITLQSKLPDIVADYVTIDASDAGVILDGDLLVGSDDGLTLMDTMSVTIHGLAIVNFPNHGIVVSGQYNQIGGDRTLGSGPLGQGNLISNNGHENDYGEGIRLSGSHHTVVGNRIGTDSTGQAAWGNADYGIYIGGSYNIVGSADPNQGNLISGNSSSGIAIYDGTYNTIIGNYIGTDPSGTQAVANGGGVFSFGGDYNLIGGNTPGSGNLISGNRNIGVNLREASYNTVSGNIIGADVSGSQPLGNGWDGVSVYDYVSRNNLIGGDGLTDGNLIAFNGEHGVEIWNSSRYNRISHNKIFSNTLRGISLTGNGNYELTSPTLQTQQENTIIGNAPANSVIEIFSDGAGEGRIFEGTTQSDASGIFTFTHPSGFSGPVVNATATNLQLNTSEFGYLFSSEPATCIVNSTEDDGTGSLRNCLTATQPNTLITFDPLVFPPANSTTITLQSELPAIAADYITIDASDAGVILAGDLLADYDDGLTLMDTMSVTIQGLAIVNFPSDGIVVSGQYNQIGGDRTIGNGPQGQGNLISNNGHKNNYGHGIRLNGSYNTVIGNQIGTDATGQIPLGNADYGIYIGGSYNTIGSTESNKGNLISGNESSGIAIYDGTYNTIIGNRIGTDPSGTQAVANGGGIFSFGGDYNLIGGNTPGSGNLISGNQYIGVNFREASNNTVSGNIIGADVTGSQPLGNSADGISIYDYDSRNNLIGGDALADRNLIAFNGEHGVEIKDSSRYNRISHNEIHSNTLRGISLTSGGNYELTAPTLQKQQGNTVIGNAPANSIIEFFSDETEEGGIFEGYIQADALGIFTFTHPSSFSGPVVNATATDSLNNTSELGYLFTLPTYTCIVTNTVSSGIGTLNNCLTNPQPNTFITFDPLVFPPLSPVTITLLSQLPLVTESNLTIDASNAGVIINGEMLSESYIDGLHVEGASNVTIKGLQIINFPDNGIELGGSASQITLGGSRLIGNGPLGEGNLLSGNDFCGIQISGASNNNAVKGNLIGTDPTGSSKQGNGEIGVCIWGGASFNEIGGSQPGEGNIISGNDGNGIQLSDSNTESNVIKGNYIGTDISGTSAISNTEIGIAILDSTNNTIGGNSTSDRNIISGNGFDGISLFSNARNNQVAGNFIGTDLTGKVAIPNEIDGVAIFVNATNNLIGGENSAYRNLISGNYGNGVSVYNPVNENTIAYNYIGTDINGDQSLGNTEYGIYIRDGAISNTIKNNLISGNSYSGLKLSGATNNIITDNYIGTDYSGNFDLGNGSIGVEITENSVSSLVSGNLISGNEDCGLTITDGSSVNKAVGNLIGTNQTGNKSIANSTSGICVLSSASNNQIGGSQPDERNLISGNNISGIEFYDINTTQNQVMGNFIGTDLSGTIALPNLEMGINIWGGPDNNIIGGTTPSEGNLISGNGLHGIQIGYTTTVSNIIKHNFIGTNKNGDGAIANTYDGVSILLGTSNNLVADNLISGNGDEGVIIGGNATNNIVQDNMIGTDVSGLLPVPNVEDGVFIWSGANNSQIGPNNIIAFNGLNGVNVDGANSSNNSISANKIFSNTGKGIYLSDGGNIEVSSPDSLAATATTVSGNGPADARIELFSDFSDEGRVYEGFTTGSVNGAWSFTKIAGFSGPFLTATATDLTGNTSEFSEPIPSVVSESNTWTILVYLNGDNNLDGYTHKLFNRLESSVMHNPELTIRVLWDRNGDNDSILYDVLPDDNPLALANYIEGQTSWHQGELDMGDGNTLLEFILSSIQASYSDYYLLSLVDHGGGWSPELETPQGHADRYAFGGSGFSWDEHSEYIYPTYLSTQEIGAVFSQYELITNPIDIVFYDACLMGMIEEAYEIRNGANYLVASENETWTSFPYQDYLEGIQDRTPAEQAAWMADKYYSSLFGYPRTMSVLDLTNFEEVISKINDLTLELSTILPTERTKITNAYQSAQKFDYNYDLVISDTEGYVDLANFSAYLIEEFPGTSIATEAQSLLALLTGFNDPFIMYERHQSGYAGLFGPYVDLGSSTGLSIYMPFGEQDRDLPFYINSQLAFAEDTYWNEFIFDFVGYDPQPIDPDYGGGRGHSPQPLNPVREVFLPIITLTD